MMMLVLMMIMITMRKNICLVDYHDDDDGDDEGCLFGATGERVVQWRLLHEKQFFAFDQLLQNMFFSFKYFTRIFCNFNLSGFDQLIVRIIF